MKHIEKEIDFDAETLSSDRYAFGTRFQVITLCGSLKFGLLFEQVQIFLERRGHVCFSICNSENDNPPTREEKSILDKVHFKKIALSDCILVLDFPYETEKRYIGESTANEIQYAELLNKEVFYMSDISKGFII